MPVTAIVGAQYGSEGKGAVVARLAHDFDVAVRTGGPNAGHSLWHNGRVYKMRQIPCAWINPNCVLVLGAGAVVDIGVLEAESLQVGRTPWIDAQAVVILEQDRAAEQARGLQEQIGSTLEGVGIARAAKIARVDKNRLANRWLPTVDTVQLLNEALDHNKHIMLEGTQGAGLSLHHGHWPFVTSNDTNAAQLCADAGIPPTLLDHTLLVARTYPIRVGGNSGPLYQEIAWSNVPGEIEPERTTVTNRQRRIGLWDEALFKRAVMLNDPCGIVITFADYLDPAVRGSDRPWLSVVVQKFLTGLHRRYGVPVVLVGTGGEQFTMAPVGKCAHGKEWS